MKILLKEWAAKNFSPAPCKNTISAWVKRGNISPMPVFIGRAYYVESTAIYLADRRAAPSRPDLTTEGKKRRLVERIAA